MNIDDEYNATTEEALEVEIYFEESKASYDGSLIRKWMNSGEIEALLLFMNILIIRYSIN